MKFLLLIFLVGASSIIDGFENVGDSLSMTGSKFIERNTILPDYTLYTGCGGVIPLSPVFYSVIRYKWGEFYEPDEFCVWTLVPGDEVTNVRVAVVYQNMADPFDGITAYFLNSTGITSQILPGTKTEFNFNTPLAFLTFSSVGEGLANAFRIEMFSTGYSGTTSIAAYHVRKDQGEFTYPIKDPTRNVEKTMALVLQRKTMGMVRTHLELNLEHVKIDEDDSLQVFSFSRYNHSPNLALMRRFTADGKIQVHPLYPVLILLESEKTLKGKGFQVEWKEYANSIE